MAFVLKVSEHSSEQEHKQRGPVEQDSFEKHSEARQAIDFEVQETSTQNSVGHILKVA